MKQQTLMKGAGALAFALGVMVSPARAQEQAASADAFVDSIGVNTHIWDAFQVYAPNYDAWLKSRLIELGVRHIRDAATPNGNDNQDYIPRLNDLANNGIHADLICDPRAPGGDPQSSVNWINANVRGAVEAVEGPNEYDQDPVGGANYQKALYPAAKNTLGNVSVYGVTYTSGGNYSQAGDLTSWLDFSNSHPYQSTRMPETGGWGDGGYGSIDYQMRTAWRVQSPSKPAVATEFGYAFSGNEGVPDDVNAKYIGRDFAYFWTQGIARSYKYEMVDNGGPLWGLIHGNDGSAKPQFYALKSLIGLLKEPGANFTPQSLDYSISGDTGDVRHLLLQKSNGDYYLILWRAVQAFDPFTGQRVSNGNANVTLTVNGGLSAATLYSYDGNWNFQSGGLAVSGNQVSLGVPDQLVVVQISRGADANGIVSGGVYKITNVHNNLCLDDSGGSLDTGHYVQFWTDNGLAPQRWRIDATGTGYKITNLQNNLCLDDDGGSLDTGFHVQFWTDNGLNPQRWRLDRQGDGTYKITNVQNNLCLDDAGGSLDTGFYVQFWTDNGLDPQRWRLDRQ